MRSVDQAFCESLYLLYYSLRRLCADEFTVKKIVGREFNKVQFSYSFSLWYSREKKLKAVVRRLPRCHFLTVSLYYTLRTINVNYLLHI